jgi:hypothetical protein
VRLAILVASLVCVASASAGGGAYVPYPANPQDAALLSRGATAQEKLAQSVAARLTRRQVAVRCTPVTEVPGVLGVTPFVNAEPRGYFLLMPNACAELQRFRSAPAAYDPSSCEDVACAQRVSLMVQALETVSHESYHTLGFETESTAECYGMQSLWYVASRLGATQREAERLAGWYWRFQYPAWRRNHPEYWSAQCRDGGALDLRKTSHAWPS